MQRWRSPWRVAELRTGGQLFLLLAAAACQGSSGDGSVTITPLMPDYTGTNIPTQCQSPISNAGYAALTFSGGTAIDGPHVMCGLGFGNSGIRFVAGVATQSGTSKISVQFEVPAGQFAGIGSYACGHETNVFPEDSIYCDIQVKSTLGQDSLTWLLSADAIAGEHSNCFILLDRLPSQGAKGTLGCQSILDGGALVGSSHPDVGKPLTVSGNFEFLPSN